MINPFNPEDMPDQVWDELSDPDLDYDRVFEDCVAHNMASPFEDDILKGDNILNGKKIFIEDVA
jgi:hypothetical protein